LQGDGARILAANRRSRLYRHRDLRSSFDRGAAWIHGADDNVMSGLARYYGFQTVTDEPQEILYINGIRASAAETENYDRAYEALAKASASRHTRPTTCRECRDAG